MGNLLMRSGFLLLLLISSIECQEGTPPEERFVVLRITPLEEKHLETLQLLQKNSFKHELDFWKAATGLHQFADVMMPASKAEEMKDLFDTIGMPYIVTVKDVQQLILEKESPRKTVNSTLLGSFAKRFKDGFQTRNRAKYGFGEYHGYGEIVRWLNEISQQYPSMARVLSIGTTAEGRNIVAIKINSEVTRTDKRVVWIDGGIHAREWGAIHTALYFIEQLIANYETDPQTRRFVDEITFYIIPVVNPDGFEYTRSDVTPLKRLWRKNRAGIICEKDQWFRDRCCGGVDLNRNFDFFWGEAGSSDDRCSEIYQGEAAFSEKESRAIRDTILSPDLNGKVDAFITLHTYSQMWIHPYSHARRSVPVDINEIESVGRRAVRALESMYGTKYRFGSGADILYPSSGGSDDWVKAKGNGKYVYLIELRPGEDVWDAFVLDPKQLIPMGRETWEGVKVVLQAVVDRQQALLSAQQSVLQTVPQSALIASKKVRTLPRSRRPSFQRLPLPISSSPKLQRLRARIIVPRPAAALAPAVQSATCRDVSPWCAAWLKSNHNVCRISSIYMSRDCARTCRFC